jgi:uncharacterized repeat protein (TIGR01451 family)
VTGADEPDPNPGNNTGTATLTPLYADLAVTKTVDKPQPNVGDTITYTVTLTNNGTATATGVELTDVLPANVTFVSATAAEWHDVHAHAGGFSDRRCLGGAHDRPWCLAAPHHHGHGRRPGRLVQHGDDHQEQHLRSERGQ